MSMIDPDVALARLMTADMAARLNVSLRHLVVEVLERPGWNDISDPSPVAFGVGAMMRDKALAGDLGAVATLLDQFRPVLEQAVPGGDLVRPLAEPWLGAAEIEVLRHGFADDIGLTAILLPPSREETKSVTGAIGLALRAVSRTCPEWCLEFEELVRLVVLARAPDQGQRFAGASAFDLWGAILVNPSSCDPLRLIMTLVHESSHLKLFHPYLDDEVVLNDPEERFSSPLRREPRPMNGLFHAAYVLARMARFAADMAEADDASSVFGLDARDLFLQEAEAALTGFDTAHDLIARHAQLTDGGSQIISDAAAAVEAVRLLVAPIARPALALG